MDSKADIDLLLRTQTLQSRHLVENRVYYFFFKRVLDLTITISALVILLPLIALISLLIIIDSRGPAIFAQERVGAKLRKTKGSKFWQPSLFTCYKFRTMTQSADPSLHQAYIKAFINHDSQGMTAVQEEDTSTRKLVHDPRVTRMGRILRKTSLDELPQLWNILTGDMSLVGPRPPILYEVEEYQPWHYRRLEATPGLTGLWQVTARSSADFDDMVSLDIEYIKHQSIWLDIKILLNTPLVVLSCKGAH